jgi:hypothetical protein
MEARVPDRLISFHRDHFKLTVNAWPVKGGWSADVYVFHHDANNPEDHPDPIYHAGLTEDLSTEGSATDAALRLGRDWIDAEYG